MLSRIIKAVFLAACLQCTAAEVFPCCKPSEFPLFPNERTDYDCTCEGTSSSPWPGKPNDQVTFPADADAIFIHGFVINLGNFHPLPSTPIVKDLYLSYVVARELDGNEGRFPLKRLTIGLQRDALETLQLDMLHLILLKRDDFEGLSKLQSLRITSCSLSYIDPESFLPFATVLPATVAGTAANYESQFKRLSLSQVYGLDTFPWHALAPFAESLETIFLGNTDTLARITLGSDGPPPSTAMSLKKLRRFTIWETGLKSVSKEVLNTIIGGSETIQTIFINNTNDCGSCQLQPLVAWARLGGSPPAPQERTLEITCRYDYPSNSPPEPKISGDSQFWRDYPIEDCQAEGPFTRPTTTPQPTTPWTATPTTPKNDIQSTTPGNKAAKVIETTPYLFFTALALVKLVKI